ncbi:hypothetical protein BDB00DRAFT_906648 [Zychaea mexicana]|uniref:uncharacterized protein n=1 Tax=Zychaea mexicana TaxID=64656 RepID=UPI0022FE2297|nr:uncharacterized protein BDB00DRAFT_906648 [Zychaea mexicana]KAI9493524.1 hypothetical protein BDB00DRAFT_906648 [Zychaea mexicana]
MSQGYLTDYPFDFYIRYQTSSTGFCSRACHAKEAAKTQIPPWATLRGTSSSRFQKAKAIASCASIRRSPILLFNCKYSPNGPVASAAASTTTVTIPSSPASPPSPRSRSPRRQLLGETTSTMTDVSPRNRSLSSPPERFTTTSTYNSMTLSDNDHHQVYTVQAAPPLSSQSATTTTVYGRHHEQ